MRAASVGVGDAHGTLGKLARCARRRPHKMLSDISIKRVFIKTIQNIKSIFQHGQLLNKRIQ